MKINKILSIILISVLSISLWEVSKKQIGYVQSRMTYQNIRKEKEQYKDMQEYLFDKDYDWISVSNTAIEYPLVKGSDNQFYLTHNYLGKESISGAIYYDANEELYQGLLTIIYGHSMKDGSMLNNLHYFQKDKDRFKESVLTIDTKEGTKTYKPIGYGVCEGRNPFYRTVDDMNMEEGLSVIRDNCDYIIEENVSNEHIIALVTCDYSIKDGRLVVFYMENSNN